MNKKVERSSAKRKTALEQKGYKEGKLPKGKVARHVNPVVEGGKTTKKNIRVVSEAKHKAIHKNRRKEGRI